MRFLLKPLVNLLFNRQTSLAEQAPAITNPTINSATEPQSTTEHGGEGASLADNQLLSIFNYWLDFELFDIPECPYDSKKGIVSEPPESFDKKWLNEKQPTPTIKDNSALFVMFQCHRAGYLFVDDEGANKPAHPNTVTPNTYLLGVSFIPTLTASDESEEKQLTWQLDDTDRVINLATIRTIYRRCRSSVPANMSLKEWVEVSFKAIDNLVHKHFVDTQDSTTDEPKALSTQELKQAIVELNRSIAKEFWPTEHAQNFMRQHAKAVEVHTQNKFDLAHRVPDNNDETKTITTFRWRFCYYPSGNTQNQLGPFFANDLSTIADHIHKDSAKNALSPALYQYLLGNKNQELLGSATTHGNKYHAKTRTLFKGRWPENPQYGLSLLQTCAVNIVNDKEKHPVVAVNGPPGTGKTTLLKDVIAERFVERTIQLLAAESTDNRWLVSDKARKTILNAAIVIASSNNKAVENISMELPSLAKIYEQYHAEIGYFKEQAQPDEWGLFCAVLGNSSNRKAFCDQRLNTVIRYFKGLSNYMGLSPLVNFQLKKKPQAACNGILLNYFSSLQSKNKLAAFTSAIAANEKFIVSKHKEFLTAFNVALEKVCSGHLPLSNFVDKWCALDEVSWNESLEALTHLSQVWWKAGLWKEELQTNYKDSKANFNELLARHQNAVRDINEGHFEQWGLNTHEHLMTKEAFNVQADEDELTAEARLQKASPLGSSAINQLRSELFMAALAVNESLIKLNATALLADFEHLPNLINGHYQSKENTPSHEKLWSLLFLIFPVVSTSLSSVESQFRLMQKKATIGLAILDEAGQAVNFHAVGLLQRSQQALIVGDPIQLEPVVPLQGEIDRGIAADFIAVSTTDDQCQWGDRFLVSQSSAQLLADRAGPIKAVIGDREVGLPLLVHRRCNEPMFSIANSIAYDDKMVLATAPYNWKAVSSGWLNIVEPKESIKSVRYNNHTEANAAFELLRFLVEHQPHMAKGGIYIITPFTHMRSELKKHWNSLYQQAENKGWMTQAAQLNNKDSATVASFANDNIGTVHTFQGKEASVVIFCLAASQVRSTTGGIKWVNSKPNLINVAVTRAKHHLFIVGNYSDWRHEAFSNQLISDGMTVYNSIDEIKANTPLPLAKQLLHTASSSSFSDLWGD